MSDFKVDTDSAAFLLHISDLVVHISRVRQLHRKLGEEAMWEEYICKFIPCLTIEGYSSISDYSTIS